MVHRKAKGEYEGAWLFGVTGFITSSGVQAVIVAPMVWTDTVNSVTVSKLTVAVRTADGTYLGGGSNADVSAYITDVSLKKAQGLFVIELRKSDGWGITNNTPFAGTITCTYSVS